VLSAGDRINWIIEEPTTALAIRSRTSSPAGSSTRLPPAHEVLSDPFGNAPQGARARSYLDAHCGHCHGPGGSAEDTGVLWDLAHTDSSHLPICRSTRSVEGRDRVLVPGQPEDSEFLARMRSPDPSVRMPRGLMGPGDRAGIALLSAWVSAMSPAKCLVSQ